MCTLAREIERAIADGRYRPEQEAQQLKRLKVIEAAYEAGGDEAAWHADMMFCAGTTD